VSARPLRRRLVSSGEGGSLRATVIATALTRPPRRAGLLARPACRSRSQGDGRGAASPPRTWLRALEEREHQGTRWSRAAPGARNLRRRPDLSAPRASTHGLDAARDAGCDVDAAPDRRQAPGRRRVECRDPDGPSTRSHEQGVWPRASASGALSQAERSEAGIMRSVVKAGQSKPCAGLPVRERRDPARVILQGPLRHRRRRWRRQGAGGGRWCAMPNGLSCDDRSRRPWRLRCARGDNKL